MGSSGDTELSFTTVVATGLTGYCWRVSGSDSAEDLALHQQAVTHTKGVWIKNVDSAMTSSDI